VPKIPECRACKVWSGSRFASTKSYCNGTRSENVPYWLKPGDLRGEVRRALIRLSDKPYLGHVELEGRAYLSTPEIRATYLRVLSAAPARTPSQQKAELAYHLKRWASHPGLTDEDREGGTE
jgi:hypothetical protein